MRTSEYPSQKYFQFGPFWLIPASRTLLNGGERISIPSRAFDVLCALIDRRGHVVEKDTLLNVVWSGTIVDENNLFRSIADLRKALGDENGQHRYVITVPGRGYSFTAEVSEVAPNGTPESSELPRRRSGPLRSQTLAIAGVVVLLAVIGLTVARLTRGVRQPQLVTFTGAAGLESFPSFSPDSRQIAYAWSQEEHSRADLYIKVIGSGQPLRIVEGPVSYPSWSPDGRFIAYSANSGIYLTAALGGPQRRLTALAITGNSVPGIQNLGWFPDGNRLVFVDRDRETGFPSIFEVSIDTGERRQLTRSPVYWGDRRPAVSPDGKTLGFLRPKAGALTAVFLMPLAGGEARQLMDFRQGLTCFAWMPNSREILYCDQALGRGTLERISISGGQPRPILEAGYDVRQAVIAPAGNRVAFVRAKSVINLWRTELDRPGSAAQWRPPAASKELPSFHLMAGD